MAQVRSTANQRISFLLQYLLKAWEDVPSVEACLDQQDLVEQIDYVEEWAPKEALRNELDRLMETTMPTLEQQVQYDRLRRLVEQYQPVLQRLRAG